MTEVRSSPCVRIVLVEDHEAMSAAMRRDIQGVPGLSVSAVARSAEEVLRLPGVGDSDLALIDISLPDRNGIDLVRVLRCQHPRLRCVMVSGHIQRSYVAAAFAAGAYGYVVKGNLDELLQAIRIVIEGQVYLSKIFRK